MGRIGYNEIMVGMALTLGVVAIPARSTALFEECEDQIVGQPQSAWAASCFERVAMKHGAIVEAIDRLEKEVAIRPDAPWLFYYLGTLRMRLEGCPDDARTAYEEAIQLFLEMRDAAGESFARTNRAIWLGRCRQELAMEEFARAEQAPASVPTAGLWARVNRLRLQIYTNEDLESVYTDLKRLWDEARQKDLDGHFKVTDVRRACLRNLGLVCYDLGKNGEARNWDRENLDLARSEGNLWEIAGTSYELVLTRLTYDLPRASNRQKILDELPEILAASEESSRRDIEAQIRLIMAMMEGGPEAGRHLDRASELTNTDTMLRQHILLQKANLHAQADSAMARDLLAEAYPSGLPTDDLGIMWNWRERLRIQWYTSPRDQALAAAEEVLGAIERARSLQTGMSRLYFLDVWSGAYYQLAGRLLDGKPSTEDLTRAFLIHERLRAQELREILRAGDPAAPELPLPPPDLLDQVEAALGDDEAMLSFHLSLWRDFYGHFAGGAWLMATSRDGTRVYRLDKDRVQLDGAVETLIAQQDGQWPPENLARFYEDLLESALGELPPGIDKLVLVPDGLLHLLPFAALGPGSGKPSLGARYEISVEPSAALWLSWKKKASPANEPAALVFAAPDVPDSQGSSGRTRGDKDFAPLPYARREGEDVVRHLRGASRVVEGGEASESFFKKADLGAYSLIHFAAHAVVNYEQPWLSGVLLSGGQGDEDGWLRPEEIAEFDLDGKVVVLSTCNSAAGRLMRGEGVMSLGRAFFEAGAHAVVGTLRLLPDKEGARFFDDFYDHLSQGLSLRQALAATQRQWIREGRPASIWASVVVMGNGDLVPVPGGVEKPFPVVPLIAVVAGLFVAVRLVWQRFRPHRPRPGPRRL